MPFVQRVVAPVHLSRVKLHDERGVPTVRDRELDAVTNCALSNALRQMASVAALADEVFRELRDQLTDVATRSAVLQRRVQALGHLVDHADPKAVTVPESDLTAFSLKTKHFKSKQTDTKNLLSADNRPAWVKRLYEQAGVPSKVYTNKPHVHRLSRRKRSLDESCLPNDIELRKPAAISNLRPWTSEEILGDITVAPDCSSRIPRDPSPVSHDQTDHTLPSPEEQQQVIALKFPPQIVEVDVSGRSFNRMSALRRSLQNVEYETSVRRRKSRRPRGKRRNTIAGTDQKELEAVIGSLSDSNKDSDDIVSSSATVVFTEKKSNLDLLKDWGRMRLKQFKSIESSASAAVKLRDKGKVGLARRKWDKDEPVHSSSGNWSASSESGQSTSTSHVPRSSVSSCSGSTKPTYHGGSSVTSDEGETGSTYSCDTEGYYTSFHVDSGLKTLREEEPSPQQQQQQQQQQNQPMCALHSTSALTPSFQSSSGAESEYDVFGRGSTSTTASSAGTVCTSLMVSPPSVPERSGSKLSGKSLPRSSSSSSDFAYGGSLPDRNSHRGAGRSPGDDAPPRPYDRSKTAPSRLTKENVTRYKEEGLMVDVQACRASVGGGGGGGVGCGGGGGGGGGDSPDSGHNTCSSPVDSVTSPSVDLEMSECSDLEGVDRVERLRVKTTINTSRIPSMCVITPPISDDEVSLKTLRAQEAAALLRAGADDDYGEYVTLAHVMPEPVVAEPRRPAAAEQPAAGFVHLDELPVGSMDRKKATGARVTLNAEGKVIYTSDSLKRRKKIHTTNTFEPGPCVVQNNVNGNVQLPAVNKNDFVSQVIPRSPLNVRPVTRQNNNHCAAQYSSQHVVAPGKKTLSEQNPPRPAAQTTPSRLQPLVPIPLTCSPGQRRSIKTAFHPSAASTTTTTDGARVRQPQRPASRAVVLPDVGRSPPHAGKPVSPMISPTRRSLSPKEVVKGAYVRMQDPTECLETCLDDVKSAVKRSDSYRQANAAGAARSPNNMLMALQKSRSENAAQGTSSGTYLSPASVDHSGNRLNLSDRQNVSASTPVKNDRSAGQIDMSSNNISPIQDCRAGAAAASRRVVTYDQHRLPRSPDGQRPLQQQQQPSPWSPNGQQPRSPNGQQPRSPNGQQPRSPNAQHPQSSAAPFVRPASGRSAMDLYAAIHESKKRLLGLQPASTGPVTTAAVTTQNNAPATIPRSQLPAAAAAALRRPAERQSDRYRPRDDPRSARYDFKRLLLQTNMAGGRRTQQSAVVRLQQPPPPARTAAAPTFRGAGGGGVVVGPTAAGKRTPPSWRSNVLSSTIQEDCREDEDQSAAAAAVPKSAALVNRTLKGLQQSATCSTLETAL